MRSPGLLTLFVLVAVPCEDPPAQQNTAAGSQRPTPAIRETVYRRLSAAQQCVEEGDLGCANEQVREVFAFHDLSSYERAQALNFQAFIDFNEDDYAGATAAYEQMLLEPDVPAGLEQQAQYSLAQLYAARQQYDAALEALDEWWSSATVMSPEPHVLRAQIQYHRGEHGATLTAIDEAIEMAAAAGREPDERWYQIRFATLWKEGEHARAAEVMETMIRLWPKRMYFIQLSGIYGRLGNPERQLDLYEAAYSAGWLEAGTEIIALAGLRLEAGRAEDALELLEQNVDRGILSEGDAVIALIVRTADWAAGAAIDDSELEWLLDEARTETETADRESAEPQDPVRLRL